VDSENVREPQNWDISFIRRFMVFLGPVSSLFDYATFALMWWFFGCSAWLAPGTGDASRAYLEQLFHTGWFVESLLTQTLIVHIIRTNRIPFIQSRASLSMLLTTAMVMAIAAALPYLPFARFFGFVPLPGIYWIWIGCFLPAYAMLAHTLKSWFVSTRGRRRARHVNAPSATGGNAA
ncbi:MAG: cation transporting ATPase C-terminal domain-containing protein, partial [Spirochaetes bacterium]|nr:cation transporting ATPase C-terminal domain-containing protein [Spirochaetota bacterium]